MDAARRIPLALASGLLSHGLFVLGVGLMMHGMWHGMTAGHGTLPAPWRDLANLALVAQFPLAHSLLLTRPGMRLLGRVGPGGTGRSLATTTYAGLAGAQLALLFWLWTPGGTVWWQAEGAALWVCGLAYGTAWLLLGWSIVSAGWQLQTGALGWLALLRDRSPRFPPMPTGGLFRLMRQPIYVAFTLTLWTVPVWTPDQLALALAFTAYCLLAPLHKERRFAALHGAAFRAYQARVRYVLPFPRRRPDA